MERLLCRDDPRLLELSTFPYPSYFNNVGVVIGNCTLHVVSEDVCVSACLGRCICEPLHYVCGCTWLFARARVFVFPSLVVYRLLSGVLRHHSSAEERNAEDRQCA